jgi:hypothetical protein
MRLVSQWLLWGLVVLLVVPGGAKAGLIFDQATFVASLQPGYYLEDFSSLVGPGVIPAPLNFSGGGFAYTATAPGDFYAVQTPSGSGNYVLSTSSAADTITLTFTSGNVTAVGGYFFVTDLFGDIAPGAITLQFSDGTQVNLTNQDLSTFTGYLSEGPLITSLLIFASQADGEAWPTVDNLYVGAGIPPENGVIPEPSTLLLFGGGLTSLALLRLRRKRP